MRGSVRALRIALAAAGLASIGISAWLVLGPSGQGLNVRPIALALVGYAMLVGMDWLGSDDDSRTAQALQRLAAGGLLGLLMIVIRDWHIEGPPFAQGIAPIVFFGFLVHHSLSPKWRPTLFLLLSLAAILLIFGTTGAWIVAIGIVLVGLCHLPVDWRLRAGLASAAGLTLILMRGGTIDSPWPAAIWPIIASIFMFRLIVYLYDLKNGKIPESWPRRLSYFFLLPNPAFPLFPVVDAQTYFSQYFRTDAGALYLRGITWMTRGIVHLLLYRFIYRELAMSAVDVHTGGQLVLYLLTNFGLYLRISGQFHLAIGVLHLFGHGLPLTNNWYWLASSFSDLWRRINIYWKEFMQKLIFFPVFMKIRNWRFGETAAVIAASLLVFVATWFLHSYQWFWILGTWLITGPDILFWSILALLMTANTLWERRKGAKKLAKRAGARARVGLALRTVGVFTTITVLWSLWNSPSIGEFFRLFAVVEWGAATTWLWLVAYVGIAGAIATVARAVSEGGFGLDAPKREFMPQVATIGVVLAALAVGVRPVVTERMSLEAQVAFRAIRRGELSERDAELIRRGYYENLV
ncbi:MAG: hypothetical protein R3195_19425, partial [Gemmatimonadota bacterium]|nr:hypothetical protein [Gemmatimonadota bacterium]